MFTRTIGFFLNLILIYLVIQAFTLYPDTPQFKVSGQKKEIYFNFYLFIIFLVLNP